MRARRRRSVLNTVSAAALEVAIMGIFVIIAQPQLRDALFEILQVDPAHTAAPTAAMGHAQRSPADEKAANSLDRTVQAVLNSPVGQAVESSLAQWSGGNRPEMNVPSLSTQPASQPQFTQPVPAQFTPSAPALLTSTPAPSSSSHWHAQPGQNQVAGYSPFDQYESLRVSVPANTQANFQAAYQQPSTGSFNNTQYGNSQYAIPQYVAPQNYAGQNYAGQNYAGHSYTGQNQAPTQLTANQWNIASAAQSPRPTANGSQNNNLIPSQVTETSFRQIYPPPYGTQSMWK